MKIKNAEQLRDHLLSKLELLDSGKIEIDELGQINKTSETIMSSLKLQLAYSGMRGEMPEIEFLQQCNKSKLIEGK